MISALIELLGNFYASNDLTSVEALARSIHAAVPDDQVSLMFLGLAYYKSGRAREALRIFDAVGGKRKARAATATPGTLRDTADGLGDHESAVVACYEEATRRSPLLARLWCDLGMVLTELRRFELAIPAFRSSIKAQPNGAVYGALGYVYRKRRNFVAARECFAWVRRLRTRIVQPPATA